MDQYLEHLSEYEDVFLTHLEASLETISTYIDVLQKDQLYATLDDMMFVKEHILSTLRQVKKYKQRKYTKL